jgi:hypothetical protein
MQTSSHVPVSQKEKNSNIAELTLNQQRKSEKMGADQK